MARLNKIPFTLRVKRGTESQIVATSPVPYQLSGELAFSTDTKDLYVSDGTEFIRVDRLEESRRFAILMGI